MIGVDEYGHATPGTWHKRYLQAWSMAFPSRDQQTDAGKFSPNGTWTSATPAWDKWWFESFGAKPPRQRRYINR